MKRLRRAFHIPPICLLASLSIPLASWAEEAKDEVVELETYITEEKIEDDLGLLPTEPVTTVFGFGKTLLETPRSVTSISIEMLDRYGITDIDDMVVLSPGSFTQSFFGVAGALDVRGTPGETYFNGVRRLDNPGNYPTPIGAADRIHIVRGPSSPIFGPSKIGGYLNFVPKSARAATGQYLAEPTGQLSYTTGSWDKNVVTAEVGGPGKLGNKEFGYYVYGESENSGSYYDNSSVDQSILQASFNVDLTDQSRISFGGMYHDFQGNQIAGWNRLTQALIDDGTYLTGLAQPLDQNGDGSISHQEFDINGDGFTDLNPFFFRPGFVNDAGLQANLPQLALEPGTVGLAKLDGSQVLVASDDVLENEVRTLYLDYVFDSGEGWTITNKLFYEDYENLNENAYGFAQFHDSWVVEDQLIFATGMDMDGLTVALQVSPSIRYTDFEHGDDYTNEHFDRRDLTGESTARDRRLLATRIDDDYTEYYEGNYVDYGMAVLADIGFDFGLNVLLGGRYDYIDMESNQPVDKLLLASSNNFTLNPADVLSGASDSDDGFSWTASVSYELPYGLIPYVTASKQTTIIAGQGADITVANVLDETAVDSSELMEVGLKTNLLEGRLFLAFAYYEQERTNFNAQSIVTNSTDETEGFEFEMRWLVTDNLILTAAYTNIEIININTLENGGRFSFFGIEDLTGVNPAFIYGGTLGGIPPATSRSDARKAGVPENIWSASASYDFGGGWAITGSVIDVDSTFSGYSQAVELPSYTLINAGLSYTSETWSFSLTGKNLTDEEYFRSNFPDLFGSAIVLPELPRSYQARIDYRF